MDNLQNKNLEPSKNHGGRTVALNRLLRKLNEELTIEHIADEMAEFLEAQFGIRYYLFFRRDKQGEFRFLHSNAEEKYYTALKEMVIPFDQPSLHAAACRKRKNVYLRNIGRRALSDAEAAILKIIPIRTLLVFPLISGDEVVGTLDLSHPNETIQLSDEDLSDLQVFVEHVAVTVRNSLLVTTLEDQGLRLLKINEDLQTEARQMAALNQLSRQLNEALDLNRVLELSLDYIKENFGIAYYAVYLLDRSQNLLHYHRSNLHELLETESFLVYKSTSIPLDIKGGMHWAACERKKYVYLRGFRSQSASQAENRIVELTQIKSLVVFPLITNNTLIGTLDLSVVDERMQLSRTDLGRLSIFSELFAGVLNNSLLIAAMEKQQLALEKSVYETEMANAQIARINEFTRRINEQTDFTAITNDIFSYLNDNFQLEFSWLILIDREKQTLFTSTYSMPEAVALIPNVKSFMDSFKIPLDESAGTLYRTVVRQKAYYLPRIPEGYEGGDVDNSILTTLRLKWFMHVPLIIRGEVIGILAFTNYHKILKLKKENIARVQSFADQIAGAVNNAYLHDQVHQEKTRADALLRNILPGKVADELQLTGEVPTRVYKNATIVFTDFVGFTTEARGMSSEDLIRELDGYFYQFDEIIRRNHLTKLKTIGDSYMFVGGLPEDSYTHAIDACLAAFEIQAFMNQMRDIKASLGIPFWELRIGLNSGQVAAGVIGKDRFAYDVWGDTVNVASRMESNGEPGFVNISETSYHYVKYFFECDYRGVRPVKNHGQMKMFFLKRIRPKLSLDGEGRVPNSEFMKLYRKIEEGKRLVFRSELEAKQLI